MTIGRSTSSSRTRAARRRDVARQFLTPYGVEFVELEDQKRIFIFDVGGPHTFRTIYMDGREHPKDLVPSYYGHNVGHWEGDTLVVDAVGFVESFWLDRRGIRTPTSCTRSERFTRTDSATIKYEVTIDDPGACTRRRTPAGSICAGKTTRSCSSTSVSRRTTRAR